MARRRGALRRDPPTASDVTEQLLTMGRESPSWGYTRLRGARARLRGGSLHDPAHLAGQRIERAPRRGKTLSWSASDGDDCGPAACPSKAVERTICAGLPSHDQPSRLLKKSRHGREDCVHVHLKAAKACGALGTDRADRESPGGVADRPDFDVAVLAEGADPAVAEITATGLLTNGWLGTRDTQSIAFFSPPGIE